MWDQQHANTKNGSFITQRESRFEVMESNRQRLKLELDRKFQNEMDAAIQNLQRNPSVKNKVWHQL